MVVEGVAANAILKQCFTVTSLRAEIEDPITTMVEVIEEVRDLRDAVSIEPLQALGWEAHGDDSGRDISKVQIKSVNLQMTMMRMIELR